MDSKRCYESCSNTLSPRPCYLPNCCILVIFSKFTQDKVQSLLSNSSDKTKNNIAQMYNLENQEIGALRNMGEKGVSDAMKKMEAIDKTALE